MTTGIFFILSAWLIWSFDPILICLIGDAAPRSLIAALAPGTAACCLCLPLARFWRRWRILAPLDRRLVIWQGVVFTAMPDLLYVFALRFAHPGLVSAILRSQVGFAVLIAFFCLRERLSRPTLAGIGLIIAANIFLIIKSSGNASSPGALPGCTLALLAAILWAGATVTGKRLLKVIPPAELVAIRMAIAALAMAAIFLGHGGWRAAEVITVRQWLLIAAKGGLITAPAFVLYMHGLRRVPVYLASALEPLAVLFTLVTAFFILGRGVPPSDLAGIFILLAGTLTVIAAAAGVRGKMIFRGIRGEKQAEIHHEE